MESFECCAKDEAGDPAGSDSANAAVGDTQFVEDVDVIPDPWDDECVGTVGI